MTLSENPKWLEVRYLNGFQVEIADDALHPLMSDEYYKRVSARMGIETIYFRTLTHPIWVQKKFIRHDLAKVRTGNRDDFLEAIIASRRKHYDDLCILYDNGFPEIAMRLSLSLL